MKDVTCRRVATLALLLVCSTAEAQSPSFRASTPDSLVRGMRLDQFASAGLIHLSGPADKIFPATELIELRREDVQRTIAIVVDDLGISFGNMVWTRDALKDFIQEWQAPNFHIPETHPFLWLLLGTLGIAGFSRRANNLTDVLLVCGVAYMSFLACRNMPLLAIVAPPMLTRHATALIENLRLQLFPSGASVAGGVSTSRRPRCVQTL